jgi:hypothetical protein
MTFLQQRQDALLTLTCEDCGDTHTGNDNTGRRWKASHECRRAA